MTGEPLNRFAAIPGYREAVERENTTRELAFLDIPETICGITVRPMTPRHFIVLDGIGSPFVCGGLATPEEVARFLWIISTDFTGITNWRQRRVRNRFIRRCRKVPWCDSIHEINRYVDETFMDSPGSKTGTSVISYWSWVAALIDQIAFIYHWSERDILGIPIKRLFQYSRICRRRDDPKAILFNESDRVKGEWLRKQNEKVQVN